MHRPEKKPRLTVCRNAEDADTGGPGSLITPKEINSGGSSSSPTEANNASSSSTTPTENNYEVFLNFRGEDTRDNFTDHLYKGLIDAGIHVFRDNEELHQGEKIGPNLMAAIKNSKILIPILSKKYGTSSWCLDELVQIMECKNNNTGTIVLPIFYKVAPADVRHQNPDRSFGKAFHKRESRLRKRGFDQTVLEKWKEALFKVCELKGREANGSEVELVKLVVQDVLIELKKKFELVLPENLVGIDNHVKEVMEYVDKNSHTILFIGIHGMGGIGKTTLAKTIYNKLSNQFEHRSFIADVRESSNRKGIHYLQNQLLKGILKQDNLACGEDEEINFLSSRLKGKKVLIVLDDVDNDDQLKALAGNHNWFSSGSAIFITTRDESILDRAHVDHKYEHEELDKDTSLILFSRHAFRRDTPPSEFKKLTDEVLSTTGGLPLSLEVLGSLFCGKEETKWGGILKKLKKIPPKKVQEKLRISYKALDNEQRQIFLDIACFFIGTDWRIASYMWDACGFFPEEGIEVLRFMSLIKIGEYHELKMHDQLIDLGRLIVHEGKESQNCSRIWDSNKALEILEENEGTKKIQAINLSKGNSEGSGKTIDQGDNILKGKQFKKLKNLRFLDARGAQFTGDFKGSMKKLKWLHWEYYPSPFEGNTFYVKQLRVLKLWGKISDKWQGWSFIKMAKDLKYLNLTNCRSLRRTSFLTAFENLEVLILKGCEKLKQIDSSIGNMRSLVCLDLTECDRLKELPAEVGELKALKQLLLGWTFISLPDSIWALRNLEILDIGCAQIDYLPESVGALQNLIILDINHTKIKKLPHGIGRLRNLRDLCVEYCNELEEEIPEGIYNLSSLQRLTLSFCYKLLLPLALPSGLKYLKITCQNRRLPSLSNLTDLKELVLLDCKFLECIWEDPSKLLEKSIDNPFELEILAIYRCKLMKTLDVSQFDHLRTLTVEDCNNILEIRGLDKLIYLDSLEIAACAIERIDLSKSKGLRLFEAKNCVNLVEIQGLNKLESLIGIVISGSTSIVTLDLRKSEGMKILSVKNCTGLVEIQGLDRWESLRAINISGCTSITRLDLSKSEGMKNINAHNCRNLVEIQGLDRLESLEEIDIFGCSSIVRLNLPKSEGLKIFGAKNCENLVKIQASDRLESSEMPEYTVYNSINSMGRPMCKGWMKLYGGLYESLYKD